MATQAQTTSQPGGTPGAARARQRSFLRDDFPVLRRAIITFVVCGVVGVSAVVASQLLLEDVQDQVQQAQGRESQSRDQRRRAEGEREAFDAFQAKFRQLGEQGFVGIEPRLAWIERVQRLQSAGKLLPIHYEIAQQQTVQIDPSLEAGSMQLHVSTMLLQMNFLHEGDLLGLLDGLQKDQTNTILGCHLHRFQQAGEEREGPRIAGDCSIAWLTATLPDPATTQPAVAGP